MQNTVYPCRRPFTFAQLGPVAYKGPVPQDLSANQTQKKIDTQKVYPTITLRLNRLPATKRWIVEWHRPTEKGEIHTSLEVT